MLYFTPATDVALGPLLFADVTGDGLSPDEPRLGGIEGSQYLVNWEKGVVLCVVRPRRSLTSAK
jgi:hypothetical protein